MKPERERELLYTIDGGDRPDVDLMADRNLVRISLFEIFLLQLVIAVVIYLDLTLLAFPLGCVLLPLAVTIWAAFRLRRFPFVTWVNPISIGVVSTMLSFTIYFVISIWYSGWGPKFRPKNFGDCVTTILFGGLGFGGVMGFFALMVVRSWERIFDRSKA